MQHLRRGNLLSRVFAATNARGIWSLGLGCQWSSFHTKTYLSALALPGNFHWWTKLCIRSWTVGQFASGDGLSLDRQFPFSNDLPTPSCDGSWIEEWQVSNMNIKIGSPNCLLYNQPATCQVRKSLAFDDS